jgi:hypothetical protein
MLILGSCSGKFEGAYSNAIIDLASTFAECIRQLLIEYMAVRRAKALVQRHKEQK